jgi:hypothetical protein
MTSTWPFEEPPNVAVITLKSIVEQGKPIVLVCHDEDDGGWQFLDGSDFHTEDAMIVSLQSIFVRDPSIGELADLPLGASASRKSPQDSWVRDLP